MQKSKWLNSLIALFVVFFSISFVGDIEDEKDLIKTADKHFQEGDYASCLEYYSQLVSNYPQNPNYNYRYGACLLYATEDKAQSLRFLSFAVKKVTEVEPIAYYYYGQALQLNYDFEAAAVQYSKFKSLVKEKEYRLLKVPHLIDQCKSAQKLIYDFKKMDVVNKKSVGKKEFFRSYNLGSMKRTIIVTPDEFLVKQDKKSEDYSIIVHNPMNEVIYFSSYNGDGSLGGKDIFKILKMPDGSFSKPVNLGPSVNTALDEDYPYLHPNGRILYFASKGRDGIGGFDIFKSELDTNTNLWGFAVNVGFSINSPADDILYVSDMDENIAYFASNRGNKAGEMTVYKILPNNTAEPIVVVKGTVKVEGSTNNTAKITVYNKQGEELSNYKSKSKSGSFIMTLDEDQSYTVGVALPGKGEVKSLLKVPKRSDWDMISKEFIINSSGALVVQDSETLLSSAEKSKILSESANLEINQDHDVDFNAAIKRPSPQRKAPSNNDDVVINDDGTNTGTTNIETGLESSDEAAATGSTDDILASAERELEEVKKSKQNLEKQIDATYHVANKKKIKTQLLKDDIADLSEELSNVFTEDEKEELTEQLKIKTTQLKSNAASATAALQLAKSKERELEVKKKQIELAETYVDAVAEASTSGNSAASINKLEKARNDLDAIQKEIEQIKENDGKAETIAKADLAQKNLADATLKYNTIQADIADIKNEQINIQQQIHKTKNKGLKEELTLQLTELAGELKALEVSELVAKSILDEKQSKFEVLSSTQNVFDEVYAEAGDDALVAMSPERKAAIQQSVKTQASVVYEIIGEKENEKKGFNTPDPAVSEKVKEFENLIASAIAAKDDLAAIQQEQKILKKALKNDLDEEAANNLKSRIKEINADKSQALAQLKQKVSAAQKAQKTTNPDDPMVVNLTDDLMAVVSESERMEVEIEESTTPELIIDLETATEKEINTLLSEASGVRAVDFPVEQNVEDADKILAKIAISKIAAAGSLIAANKAQIKYESEGGSEDAEDAQALKESAVLKVLEAAQDQAKLNEASYTKVGTDLEKSIYEDGVTSTEIEAALKVLKGDWENAKNRRAEVGKASKVADKVRLTNEANELERDALEKQQELKALVAQQKVALQELFGSKEEDSAKVLDEELAVENRVDESGDDQNSINNAPANTEEANAPEVTQTVAQQIEGGVAEASIDNTGDVTEVNTVNNNEGRESSQNDLLDDDLAEGDISEDIELKADVQKSTDANNISAVAPEDFNKAAPTAEAIQYGNKEGYGIERDPDYAYSLSSSVRAALAEAKVEENEALDLFYKAKALKTKAEEYPEKAEKYEKEAAKLIKKGWKAQEKANEKYQELNKTELDFNKKQIDFALEYNEIAKKDSAKILAKEADDLFAEAIEARKEAEKLKDTDYKAELTNKAYQLELQAIAKQNYILSGALDDEGVDETPQNVPSAGDNRPVNEYTKQADALRALAEEETDSQTKRKLFEEARLYDLAGNTSRTERLLDELTADKAAIENNQDFLVTSRELANNNTPANKAWLYEQKSDSLFAIAEQVRIEAEQSEDGVDRLKKITKANELFAAATEQQALAIRKYQESKAAPDEPDFIAEFRKEEAAADVKKTDAEKLAIATDPVAENTEIGNEITSDIDGTADETETELQVNNSDEAVSDVSEDAVPLEEQQDNYTLGSEDAENADDVALENTAVNDAGEFNDLDDGEVVSYTETEKTDDNTTDNNDDLEDAETRGQGDQNTEMTTLPAESVSTATAQEAYISLIAEADEAEAQESARVDRIVHLENQSGINRNKSEELLAQVDELNNENEILSKISEANKFRDLAEKQEVEAKNEELILKNNVAESRAKRKEAEMILSAVDESEQQEVMAAAESDNEDLKKVREFVGDVFGDQAQSNIIPSAKTISEPSEVVPEVDEVVAVGEKTTSRDDYNSATNQPARAAVNNDGIDMNAISLLSDGGTENSILDDEFTLKSNKRYTSADQIPIDPPMPNGIIYQVQVGAFREAIDPSIFNGLSPLVGERTSTGIIRYKVGYFRGFKSANMAKGRIQNLGFRDAFVVVFYNGQRISIDRAQEVIAASDESEQFIYDNLVQDEVQQLKALGIKEDEGYQVPLANLSASPVVVAQNVNQNENGLSNDLLKVGGLFYTVQVGVFSTPRISADLSGVTPLYTEKTSNGFLRYTTGVYRDFNSADARKLTVRNQGISDAFVTAYNNNQRITPNQAKAIQEENGTLTSSSNNQNSAEESEGQSGEITFMVQVGAYRAPIDVNETPVFKDLTSYSISNIKTSSGLLIYMVGSYITKTEADALRQKVIAVGGADCFVVAMQNGVRIPMRQALQTTR